MFRSTSGAALAVADTEDAQRRSGRLKAFFILLVCAAPTIAAYLAFYVWQPQGRVNYGELIEPRPVAPLALFAADGRPFSFADLRGKWVMVQFDDAACAEPCSQKLFNMRQSRLAQGREAERIERVWVVLDDGAPPADLARLLEDVHVVRGRGAGAMAGFPAAESVRDHVYLVDPLGNVMLRFPRDADPRRMIKDLQRLLKVSRVG
jgi:cytochrome oxidase Cu insertion factor (SCO1/SenC/PrrC family)